MTDTDVERLRLIERLFEERFGGRAALVERRTHEVELLGDRSILGQYPHDPTRLSQHCFEATSSKIILLGFGSPGIYRRKKLNTPSYASTLGILGDLFGDVGINY